MRYLVVVFMLVCSVAWAETGLKDNKLYINQEILDSFKRCNYVDGDNVWHTAMLSQQQGFFNSIWISDKEYGDLRGKNKCNTKYRGEDIEIIVDTNVSEKLVIKNIKDTLDKIYSMICDLETKFMGNDRMEQITNPDHIPETVRQETWSKNQRKEYIDELNKQMKNKRGWVPYKDKE